jgi:hypothetical protein
MYGDGMQQQLLHDTFHQPQHAMAYASFSSGIAVAVFSDWLLALMAARCCAGWYGRLSFEPPAEWDI